MLRGSSSSRITVSEVWYGTLSRPGSSGTDDPAAGGDHDPVAGDHLPAVQLERSAGTDEVRRRSGRGVTLSPLAR